MNVAAKLAGYGLILAVAFGTALGSERRSVPS